ncbi:MAG TPA: hypothetical protein ENI60_01560 [Candidatus Fraserbacteria bacterium]|nr:hypothetical protein [Candidatus Fraserbacteria bacterium]
MPTYLSLGITPSLGLALYAQGLSLRRTALVLAQLGVRVSHVAVWYWIQSFFNNWTMWNDSLPDAIVVDETRVKKVFDCSFPQHHSNHGSITNWLRMFAWFHNLVLKKLFGIS